MRKCIYCDQAVTGKGKLCPKCKSMVDNQHAMGLIHTKLPITYCRHPGCYEPTTETGLCEEHSKLLNLTSMRKCSLRKCTKKTVVGTLCLRHYIESLELIESPAITLKQALKLMEVARCSKKFNERRMETPMKPNRHTTCSNHTHYNKDEYVKENPLPEFLRDNPAFMQGVHSGQRCNYHIECSNQAYRGGLCITHYKLKHGDKSLTNSLPINQAEVRRGDGVLIGSTLQKDENYNCKTDGCTKIATTNGFCHTCWQIKAKEIVKKIKNKNSK